MKYVLAIVFPPLAVFLCGKPFQTILNVVLTLCFIIPGVVHALAVVTEYEADDSTHVKLKAAFAEHLRTHRAGYTLVEMLVAVALVLIIMLLLATVFTNAVDIATKQKGTAENDQQARTFTTIIQGDICSRSFRKIMPFRPIPATQDINSLIPDDGLNNLRGYFSISENNPDSQKDDVLSFTIDYREAAAMNYCTFKDTSGILGKALILGGNSDQYLFNNPNQPERDDGYPYQNETGLSQTAEVCYFLRGQNLHRRILMIRDQDDDSGSANGQPTDNAGTEIVTGDYPGMYSPQGSPSFWRDFDYSAIYDGKPLFHIGYSNNPLVLSSLDNSKVAGFFYDFGSGAPSPVPLSLGIPHFRYGHDITDSNLGRSLEFQNAYVFNLNSPNPDTAETEFIGRYTAQECSHSAFTYPGSLSGGNPMDPNAISATDNDNDGVIDQLDSPNRRGDDILLTNVLEFDLKVWDDIRREFVDLGYGGANVGRYHRSRNINSKLGNKLDTWHWFGGLQEPPYIPAGNGPDLAPGVAGVDDDENDVFDDITERGWPGSDDEQPLKALRVIVRYTDPASGLVRTVTLDHSLLD